MYQLSAATASLTDWQSDWLTGVEDLTARNGHNACATPSHFVPFIQRPHIYIYICACVTYLLTHSLTYMCTLPLDMFTEPTLQLHFQNGAHSSAHTCTLVTSTASMWTRVRSYLHTRQFICAHSSGLAKSEFRLLFCIISRDVYIYIYLYVYMYMYMHLYP